MTNSVRETDISRRRRIQYRKGRWWGHQGRGIEVERKDVEKWRGGGVMLRKRRGRKYRGRAHRGSQGR